MLFRTRLVPGAAPAQPAGAVADEVAWLRCAAAGDAAALTSLYGRHGQAVYRYAWLLTGSEAAAADVVQDCFVSLLDGVDGFDPSRGSVAGYLCGIARHLAARHRDRRVESVDDADTLDAAVAADDPRLPPPPADAAERAQALQRLYAAIRRLPPHYRDVLVLVELQQLSYVEAAALAGIELGTVRSRLSRAKARLLELLAGPAAIEGEGRLHD